MQWRSYAYTSVLKPCQVIHVNQVTFFIRVIWVRPALKIICVWPRLGHVPREIKS